MIDTKALRSRVLDLAIQGKLTEQLAEDGTAEELLAQIQAEKQRLIKEGKLKKEKPLPEIKLKEVPFEIPNNWKWTYLGELFQHNTGKALNSANTAGTLLDYITTSNVYWDRFELKSLKQMRFTDDEIDKCTVTKGDLLICEGGDIGRSAIWCYDYDIRIQNHLHRLRGYVSDISAKYYYYLMMLYKETGKIDGRGIGLQGFSSKRVHSLVVPLPPLAEQKRIVARVEEIFR
ncbi:MAG: restriction endonuclease subunit S, partial [Oscillospiraceae bacterium]|nr:restriction endonuclease subunit S [Oscillospiraceae bacterium]